MVYGNRYLKLPTDAKIDTLDKDGEQMSHMMHSSHTFMQTYSCSEPNVFTETLRHLLQMEVAMIRCLPLHQMSKQSYLPYILK